MQKHLSKALAMAVMMSMLAGGSAYAQTFTETVVIDGNRPITLNPNGSAFGTQSIEIAGPNNLLSAIGSDRFEISKEGNVVAGIYAGGLTSYGSTYESFYGASGLEISSRGAYDPYMAFTADNVDVGNNVIKNVKAGDISSATSTDAVNGGQLYTALQGKVDAGTATGLDALAVGKTSKAEKVNSMAIGNGALASEDSAIAMGNSAYAGGSHSVAIGNDAYAEEIGAYAIGQHSSALGKNSYAIGNNASAKADNSIALGNYSVAEENNTISVGPVGGGRRIVNVAKGEKDTDAVNFSQIKAVDGNYVKEANTVAENFTALDTQVKTNADDIASLKTSKADKTYVDTELAKKANAADVYTKSETESAISTAVNTATAGKADKSYVDTELGKKADKATTLAGYGITDAYTKSDTDTELAKKADQTALDTETKERKDADADLQKQIDAISGGSSAGLNELNNKINQTNDRVDRVGATAAALAAINYQPMAKGQSQVAVGMGGYKGKKATALGLAYQITDRVSGSVAGAANGSEHMFNVGFNYLFGQHSEKDVAQMAAVPGSMSLKEAEMQATIDSQNAKINSMEARMAQLEAMVKALATK